MKNITREQVDNALEEVGTTLSEDLVDALAENIQNYSECFNNIEDNNALKQNTIEMAVLSTSIQFCTEVIRGTLYKLLCNEE